MPDGNFLPDVKFSSHRVIFLFLFLVGWTNGDLKLTAAETVASPETPKNVLNRAPRYRVITYVVRGYPLLSSNVVASLLSRHTGSSVSLNELAEAALDLQAAYRRAGHPQISIAFAPDKMADGSVTFNVAQTAVPQIVISGKRFLAVTNLSETTSNLAAAPVPPSAMQGAATNTPAPVIYPPARPATPEELARGHAALLQKMAELAAREKDTRVHVMSTNAGPRFAVEKYLIGGNTVLSPRAMAMVLTNIDGAYGTNVSLDGVRVAVEELQRAYRERGYVTVAVGLPQQKLTNQTVKVQVTEGRLAAINVTGNHYFSSNNVMRALPSLHTNIILNGLVFQAELNRANANQDRQIYPIIAPGADPGTSDVNLKVKDRLPLHAKTELNNESSPGTPDLRINSSAVYNNLWQLEHSLGVQYSFSPESYKQGSQWEFCDVPLVANYSAFYRMPLGGPEAIEDVVANNPGSFGYNEATRKFNLPPASGQPELTIYGSRSTIDTGVETLSDTTIFNNPGVRSLSLQTVQQDTTINDDLGFRLSHPLPEMDTLRATLAAGIDYKSYTLDSFKTNIFTDTEITYDRNGNRIVRPIKTYNPVPDPTNGLVGVTISQLDYLPLALRYDAAFSGYWGIVNLGLGASVNAWYSGSRSDLQAITGSRQSSGHWVTLNPSFSWRFYLHTNWLTTVRADGQWASEPLISNEQFGAGGVNSVRGYREGEVFGDTGWHVSLEQQTPPHVVGIAYANAPLTIRGLVYMDYANTYLLDPQGRAASTALCGVGFGGMATLGSHWDARLLFSWPLLGTATTEACVPFFNFGLTAQF